MSKSPDWHQIRFLESAVNLKRALHAATGRTPSTTLARSASACLQQGRFYYEAAAAAPLEIRPLLLYYGLLSFARAIVICRTGRDLSTLDRSHGLRDVTADGADIAALRVAVAASGTFPAFNDQVRLFSRMLYDGPRWRPGTLSLPAAASSELAACEFDLKSLLARVPQVRDLYRATFAEPSAVRQLRAFPEAADEKSWHLIMDEEEPPEDADAAIALLKDWRDRHPFLRRWHLYEAESAAGKFIVRFCNLTADEEEEYRDLKAAWPNLERDHHYRESDSRLSIDSILPPLAGGVSMFNGFAVSPLAGRYVSEFSVHFLALFALSSLVRYRPDTWAHAISRSAFGDKQADDRALALIERFLEVHVQSVVPLMVLALNPREDRRGL